MEKHEELLRIKHLKKYFPTPNGLLYAVDDVNFSISKGETLGVVGESGCGKSTLGRCILRLIEPTDGEVIYQGENIVGCSKEKMKELRKELQIIFQDPYESLNPRMTVSQAIQAPLIMMSQNRQEEKDRRRAENDYKVNLKTEIMIEDLYDKVNAILAKQSALEKRLQTEDKNGRV